MAQVNRMVKKLPVRAGSDDALTMRAIKHLRLRFDCAVLLHVSTDRFAKTTLSFKPKQCSVRVRGAAAGVTGPPPVIGGGGGGR
jgi:hypothetical protein